MPHILIAALLLVCAGILILISADDAPRDLGTPVLIDTSIRLTTEPLLPLPESVDAGPAALVALGEKLFHDPLLSRDGTHACASCHPLERGGTDGEAFSRGADDLPGVVNTPTIFNVSFNFAQFWDGRAPTLIAQLHGPIHSKHEMATSWPAIVHKLRGRSNYREAFAAAGWREISAEAVAEALVAYERSLITPNARFDRFLRGELGMLSGTELEGYRRFKQFGCASCHQGVNVGGNLFHRFGVMRDYFADRGALTEADLGRYNITGRERDRYVFRVPSLRNVAETGPYFHDAHAATLKQAVSLMAQYQLGRELSDDDLDYISAFLATLTGEWPGAPQEARP